VGKDADVVIWNAHPLSVYARVDTTFIDGDVYFDREKDLAGRAEFLRQRAQLEEAEPNRPPRGGASPQAPRRRPPTNSHDDEDGGVENE
jgi:hypothetical protein